MTSVNLAAAATIPSQGGKHHTKRPIDLVHLAKFTLGDTELEKEILGLFEGQSLVYLGQLEKAASFKEWHAAAHTIKGAAKSVGAHHVAALAEVAENMADDAGTDEKAALVQKMRAELDQVAEYIQGLLGSRA